MKQFAAAFAFILTACAPAPHAVMQNETSISIEHDAWERDEAFRIAQAHCKRYGKNAVHVTSDGGAWKVSSFRCE